MIEFRFPYVESRIESRLPPRFPSLQARSDHSPLKLAQGNANYLWSTLTPLKLTKLLAVISADRWLIVTMNYYVYVIVSSCLDPVETVHETFNKHCSLAGARRTSPSNIASILPSPGRFGHGEGVNINIIIDSNDQPPIVP